MRALIVLSAAILAGCAPEEAAEPEPAGGTEMAAGMEAPQAGPGEKLPDPPAPPPPPPPDLAGLLPLSEAEIAGALGPGPSCTLGHGGRPLMVATVGDAIVKDRGRIVHLTPEARDWKALVEGGRFTADGLVVDVDAGAAAARPGDLIERDTSLDIRRGRRGFGVSHGPRWACRA